MMNCITFNDKDIERSIGILTDELFGSHWISADKLVIATAQAIADLIGDDVQISGVMNVTIPPAVSRS